MYNSLQLIKRYLHYRFSASSGKGHGIHSPFVFDLITNVLQDKKIYDCYHEIETRRNILLHNQQVIVVTDFGAGSALIKSNKRKVKDIAASSLKSKKYAQLLFRVVKHYCPETILELGTSFGITTAYLAFGNLNAKIITCEGSPAIAKLARQGFEQLHLQNIELVEGDFEQTLPAVLSDLKSIGLAFVDGNHRKQPTLRYFAQLAGLSTPLTILIFDDIHWSLEMEEAWQEIKLDPRVTLTVDLFYFGIVFFNPGIKIKQDFIIRF